MTCKTHDLNYEIEINSQKKIKHNYKINIKKNKCRVIKSYEVESITNQMSKDQIKKSITQKDLKNKGEKKNSNQRANKNFI